MTTDEISAATVKEAPAQTSFFRSSVGVFASNATSGLLVFVTTIVTARLLEPSGRGEFALGVLIPIFVVTLISLGLAPATTYLVAQGEYPAREVLGTCILGGAVIGVVGALGLIGLVPWLHEGPLKSLSPRELALSISAVPLGLLAAVLQGFLLGAQRFRAYNVSVVGQSALVLIGVLVVFGFLGPTVAGALLANVMAYAILCIGLVLTCRLSTGGIIWLPSWSLLHRAAKYGIQSHVSNVLTFLGYRIDMFFIGAFLSSAAVGVYSVAVATAERAWLFSFAVSTVLFPRLAGETNANRRKAFTPVVSRNVLLMTAAVCLLLFVVSRPLIALLYATSFAKSVGPLQALLPGIVLFSVGRVLANDIAARGRPLVNSCIAGTSVVVNIGINLVLIPRYGVTGAAWASSVSYGILFLCAMTYYCIVSGNTVRSVILPTRSDVALWRSAIAGLRRLDDPLARSAEILPDAMSRRLSGRSKSPETWRTKSHAYSVEGVAEVSPPPRLGKSGTFKDEPVILRHAIDAEGVERERQ